LWLNYICLQPFSPMLRFRLMVTQHSWVERFLLVCSAPLVVLIYLICLVHLGWLLARMRFDARSKPTGNPGPQRVLAGGSFINPNC
jgi:hypothetical protein